MTGTRFTTWLSEDESSTLEAIANESATSKNLIVRLSLRAVLLDKPIPEWLRHAARKVVEDENHTVGTR